MTCYYCHIPICKYSIKIYNNYDCNLINNVLHHVKNNDFNTQGICEEPVDKYLCDVLIKPLEIIYNDICDFRIIDDEYSQIIQNISHYTAFNECQNVKFCFKKRVKCIDNNFPYLKLNEYHNDINDYLYIKYFNKNNGEKNYKMYRFYFLSYLIILFFYFIMFLNMLYIVYESDDDMFI